MGVYGEEWSYGPTHSGTGIKAVRPRCHKKHPYRCTMPLGITHLGEHQVRALLARMEPEWRGSDYKTIGQNCMAFCRSICQELGDGQFKIPGWVDRATRSASALDA